MRPVDDLPIDRPRDCDIPAAVTDLPYGRLAAWTLAAAALVAGARRHRAPAARAASPA